MSTDPELIVFVTLHVLPGKRDAVLSLLESAAESTRTEPGCLQYSVYTDEERDLELMMIERWASDEALEEHLTMPYEIELLERVVPLLASPPAIRRTRNAFSS